MNPPFFRTLSALEAHYGGRRAAYRYYKYRIWELIGGFRQCTNIKWKNVERLVFVCRGNICRSPYAEMRARKFNLNTISAGFHIQEGRGANIAATNNALKRGIMMDKHESRCINNILIDEHDLLIGMEPWHAERLFSIAGLCDAQVTLLGLWSKKKSPYIHDPYGRSNDYFQKCFSIIDSGVNELYNVMAKYGEPGS